MVEPADSPLIPDRYSFFVPLEKSYVDENGDWVIEGIASNGGEDQEGDTILPDGADYSYFLDRGFLKWEHGNKPDQFIGEPFEAKVTPEGLFIRCRLYPHMELAQKAVQAMEGLKKSNAKRRMGFSIEGSVLKRDEVNPKKILKAIIRNVVLTMNPVNQHTWADLAKSFSGLDSLEFSLDEQASKSLDTGTAMDGGIIPQHIEGVDEDEADYIKRMRYMLRSYLRKHARASAKVQKSFMALKPDQIAQDCFDFAVDGGMHHDEADELASYMSERAGIVKSIFAGGVNNMQKALAFLDSDLEELEKSIGQRDEDDLKKSMEGGGDQGENDEGYEEDDNDNEDNDGDDSEEDNDNEDGEKETEGDGTEKSLQNEFDVTEWLDTFMSQMSGGFDDLSKSIGAVSGRQDQVARVVVGLGRAMQEQQKMINGLRKSLTAQVAETEKLASQPVGRKGVVDQRERRTLNKSLTDSEGADTGRTLPKSQIADELYKSWEKGDIHEDVVAAFESRNFLEPTVAKQLNIAWQNPRQ